MYRRQMHVAILLWGSIAGLAAAAEPAKPLPPWEPVEAVVRAHFAALKGYRGGDLLSRGQVEPIFGRIEALGWKVADKSDIVALVCDDRDPFVREIRTAEGTRFLRRATGDAGLFDRLHRLTMTEGGPRTLHDIIRLPNGVEVAQTLTSDPRGKDIARRLAKSPKARDFDKPTGRIYTEAQFVARLRESHAAAVRAAAKAK